MANAVARIPGRMQRRAKRTLTREYLDFMIETSVRDQCLKYKTLYSNLRKCTKITSSLGANIKTIVQSKRKIYHQTAINFSFLAINLEFALGTRILVKVTG
jgi:hypothetical protein